jgi:GT2 family glycosyltransferase
MIPEVYIVILNFNSGEDTVNCIKSLEKINYANFKIVVVDNASKDNSLDIIKNKCTFDKLIVSEENLGYANGNNIGIRYALENNAEYICILNNDTEVEPDFLNILMDRMVKDGRIGIIGPCICDFKEREKVQTMGADINLYTGLAQGKFKNYDYSRVGNMELKVDYLGGACFVVRKKVFETVGLIPENYFLFYEETEFCLRTKKAGFDIVSIGSSRIFHKRSATIAKFKGLSYFFLNRNRVVFVRRNASIIQKAVFSGYLVIETLGRIIIRKEPFTLFKFYLEGLKADKNNIDMDSIKAYVK